MGGATVLWAVTEEVRKVATEPLTLTARSARATGETARDAATASAQRAGVVPGAVARPRMSSARRA